MFLSRVLFFFAFGTFSVSSESSNIKWKCLDAFNNFREKAAIGGLSDLLHLGASKALEDEGDAQDLISEDNRNRTLVRMATQVGPMANVKQLIWDDELAKAAAETAKKCPLVGGKKGEKHREFSLYYVYDKDDKDLQKTITKQLEIMTPWMRSVTPPDLNDTMLFYVAGEFFWATRERIGCVNVSCETAAGPQLLLECHMSPGNDLEGLPYIPGEPCSKCDPGYVCDGALCSLPGNVRPKGEASKGVSRFAPSLSMFCFMVFVLIVNFKVFE